ncbi:MAG: response regulator [Aestuariibaculum sp.]
MKYSVAIVDDHHLLSQAIGEMVDGFDQFKTIHISDNGQELLTKLANPDNIPDLVLMDINMPVFNGIETTNILSEKYPKVKVVALSVEEDEKTILQMLRAGAKGYLIKDTRKDILEKALLETMEKGYYHTNNVTNILLESLHGEKKESFWELKERELEFINLACTDYTYKEIAEKMFLSPKTIDNYRDSVFTKLNVRNRIGLVLFAFKNGLCNYD